MGASAAKRSEWSEAAVNRVDYGRPPCATPLAMSAPPPLSDPDKFTTIAHAGHRYYSPMSPARAASLVALLHLGRADTVLDIGCGRAQFLLEVLQAHPARGVGVDRNAAFIAMAETTAGSLQLSQRL